MSHKIVEWNYVCKSKNQRQSKCYFWVKLLLIYWDFNKRGFPFDSKVIKYINNLIYLFIDKGITHDMDFFLFIFNPFIHNVEKYPKCFKHLGCSHLKMFKVCLAIFMNERVNFVFVSPFNAWCPLKGQTYLSKPACISCTFA